MATVEAVARAAIGFTLGLAVYEVNKKYDHVYNQELLDEDKATEKPQKTNNEKTDSEKFKFPENPDDLLPELPRDDKGRIRTADNLRIRPEKHEIEEGQAYNPRHHGQHYHVETRRNPNEDWRHENKEIIKPPGYYPGIGTGFVLGEIFPGVI